MARPKITITPIRERYLHGDEYVADDGNHAEVLRCEAGVWHAFFYNPKGKMWVIGHHENANTTRSIAIQQARAYLESGVLPKGEVKEPYLAKVKAR